MSDPRSTTINCAGYESDCVVCAGGTRMEAVAVIKGHDAEDCLEKAAKRGWKQGKLPEGHPKSPQIPQVIKAAREHGGPFGLYCPDCAAKVSAKGTPGYPRVIPRFEAREGMLVLVDVEVINTQQPAPIEPAKAEG